MLYEAATPLQASMGSERELFYKLKHGGNFSVQKLVQQDPNAHWMTCSLGMILMLVN